MSSTIIKNSHILYRELIYRNFFVIYEFENEKAYFFKIKENNSIQLIKCLKNNSFFYKEALEILQNIKSNNLTQINEIYFNEGMNYIKMDFFENSFTLKQFLKTYTDELNFEQFQSILLQLAEIIDLFHQNNIAHFDIIYPNILINHDYQIKVTDFDLIKIFTIERIEYKLVDIHCYAEIVFRLISKICYIDKIVKFNISTSKYDLDYSSCVNFLKSLKLRKIAF